MSIIAKKKHMSSRIKVSTYVPNFIKIGELISLQFYKTVKTFGFVEGSFLTFYIVLSFYLFKPLIFKQIFIATDHVYIGYRDNT